MKYTKKDIGKLGGTPLFNGDEYKITGEADD